MNTATKPRKRIKHNGGRKIKARAKTGTYQDSIYPTADERNAIQTAAAADGLSYSGWIIRAALEKANRMAKAKAKK